ncbi:urease accessory protein UreD [Bacillus sp. MM2020_1]|nr:urease accessory protein UreD [Bacillus sp. MM2020_1]
MDNWTGYLRLTGARKGKKTIVKESYSEGAFKITRPVYLSTTGEACFYIMNPGGGYVDGDTYKIDISMEEDAMAIMTTQSSTKIYKTPARPASQEITIDLKSGSVLEYLPDPVIAYQHACYKQRTVVRMDSGSSFICSDIFTPGWAPDGTVFKYGFLQSKMEVYREERLILFDHLKIQPDGDIMGIGLMEGFTHLGTMIVINDRVTQFFLEELHDYFELVAGVRVGLTMLAVPGFVVRVLANTTQEIEKVLAYCHERIRKKLLEKGAVFLRKY